MTEVEKPPQNGIDLSSAEDEESSKARPADIEQDMREMERRKRVEAIMGSKLFREELERIVDCARDSGNAAGILQQLSDIVGVPSSRVGSVFKTSTCMLPINDIRGVESMGYAKGEKILRCKLAATFRLLDLYGWTQGLGAQITARLKVDQEYFLVNPYGLLYHEITASSLNKVDMQGNIVEQGTTNFGVNKSHFVLHSVVHAARPDIRCAIYIGCSPVVAISSLKTGLLPLTKDACVLGELTSYSYIGYLHDEEERNKLVRNFGPNSKVMLLSNHGALCCGETIEEAFFAACHIVQACETQLKLLPVGLDNLVLIPEESRKIIYDQSRRPPEDLEKKFAAATITDSNKSEEEKKEGTETTTKVIGQAPKWRVGGAEFEALMRMLDNAGYRTGYIYRHPLIKSEPPKPKNDVELPPAVSSLGYLLEEEELFRQGIWKKGDLRKGGDRSRWLNSPNVYQKVEVLETGTPDPKKITKWVAEGSPTHSTPVRIDDPLQFVPVNTNPKEFKRVQQQIKDNRRADKISAGPQSHILEGVTWDEANRIKDATVSSAGDHVVLMGAASKGIIQRGFQHNAAVYKAPYAKNPFDNVTDDELNEYKRTVERKKKSIHGEYTDTDFSESEALSSLQTSGAQQQTKPTTSTTTTTTAAVSQSEPEDISEHQVLRIQTEQAPVPSQPEVVLSDVSLSFINGERSHTATNRKPPTGRDVQFLLKTYQRSQDIPCHYSSSINQFKLGIEDDGGGKVEQEKSYFIDCQANNFKFQDSNNRLNSKLINKSKNDLYFQNQNEKTLSPTYANTIHKHLYKNQGNGNLSKSSIYDSPCQYFSTDIENFENSSYYTSCVNKDDSVLNLDREHSTCYDKNISSKGKKLVQTCCTPKICNQIFESLLKSKSLQNYEVSKSSKSNNNYVNLFKVNSIVGKVNCPYRTVSHFGFNSPIREHKPIHKHIAVNLENGQKYVPLRRSVSYEEIFSSPRYLNFCDHCFEHIVLLKPELMKYETKLHNLTERTNGGGGSCFKLTANSVSLMNDDQNFLKKNNYSTDLNEFQSEISFQLDPVEEIEEKATSIDYTNDESAMTTTFNDKITRTNYCELTSYTDYINSPICFPELNEIEDSGGKKNNSNNETLNHVNNNRNYPNSATEIYEFNNWFGLDKFHETKQESEFYENTVKIQNLKECSKKLMSREERSRRKLEFQELFEDYVSFDENRNNVKNTIVNNNTKLNVNETFNDVNNYDDDQRSVFTYRNKSNLLQKDVENCNATLSRLTFSSSDRRSSETNLFFRIFPPMNIKDVDTTINGKMEFCQTSKCDKDFTSKNNCFDVNKDLLKVSDYKSAVDFCQNDWDGNTDKYSPLERTILNKIYTNELNKSEEIFGKIENTIRNKITPSTLELLIKEQVLHMRSRDKENPNKDLLNKSLNLSNAYQKEKILRLSHSLTPLKINSSTPKSQLNKTSSKNYSHKNTLAETNINKKLTSVRPYLKKSNHKISKNRNFILENIRNVSISRQTPQIKRLQSNIDNKIRKSCAYENNVCKTPQKQHQLISPSNTASSGVYSFQSKLVKGSPRFWISMTQKSPTQKNVNSLNNSLNISAIDTEVVSKVDAEINALGNEIQQIQPRLEKYKRKLDEFGNRVADCVNNINECVTAQENIIGIQQKLRNCIQSHQYTEEIMCRMQTFSLSETED